MITKFNLFGNKKYNVGDYVLISKEGFFADDNIKCKIIDIESGVTYVPYKIIFQTGLKWWIPKSKIIRLLTEKEIEELVSQHPIFNIKRANENKVFESDTEIQEIDLYRDIYRGEPHHRFVNKNYQYVINKLSDLIGKYVNFSSRKVSKTSDRTTLISTTLHSGFVEDVAYDNVGGNKIAYIKLENDKDFKSIDPDSKIFVNLTLTDAKKYNI